MKIKIRRRAISTTVDVVGASTPRAMLMYVRLAYVTAAAAAVVVSIVVAASADQTSETRAWL